MSDSKSSAGWSGLGFGSAMAMVRSFSAMARKPRVDDLDPVTGKPRFANFADYEDAKDEWLIEEAMRRLQAMQPAH